MTVIGFLIGFALGVGIAYLITAGLVKSSNDLGDSKGKFRDFSDEPLNVIESKNRVSAKFIPSDFS